MGSSKSGVVVREHEQHARQVDANARKVFIHKLGVLGAVRHVRQDAHQLAALLGPRDLIQLVDVDDRVHAFGFHQNVHDPPPRGADVGVGVSFQRAAVAGATQRNEGKRARFPVDIGQTLADAILGERGLACPRRAFEPEAVPLGFAGDPLRDDLFDGALRFAVPEHTCLEYLVDVGHIGFGVVFECDPLLLEVHHLFLQVVLHVGCGILGRGSCSCSIDSRRL